MEGSDYNRFKARIFHEDSKGSYLIYGYFLGATSNGNIRFAAIDLDSLDDNDPTQLVPIEYPPTVIVEQCTGLQDLHGDWIFEGDYILSMCSDEPIVVTWCEDGSWGMEKPWYREIVGNIHEGRSGFRDDMQTNNRMKEW